MTPTEAAAVAVFYAAIVGLFVVPRDPLVAAAGDPDPERGGHRQRLLPAGHGGRRRLDPGGPAVPASLVHAMAAVEAGQAASS